MNTYAITITTLPLFLRKTTLLLSSLLIGITGYHANAYAQSSIGKIVIDGVVYGEGDSNVLKGNGVKAKENRNIADFQNIQVSGSVDVFFQQSSSTQLEISGDQNILPIIKTEVSHGTLKIYPSESYQPRLPVVIHLTGPKLNAVSLDGAGDITLEKLNSSALKLDLNGSGNVNAEGKADTFTVNINGSNNVEAKKLTSNQAEINIIGSGDVNLTVKQRLKANIVGSGDIHYYGNPKQVEPSIVGSGDVEAGD